LVKEGTPVMVIDQPVKVGWLDGELYLQVHPSQKQAEEVEATGTFTPEPASDLAWLIVSKAGDAVGRIDWRVVERAAEERNGIAVKITTSRQPDRHMAAGEP
jgi:L,D-transpeptidase ErfK/SrfK